MLQVYTGNGKGRTTAAIGLAIRSLGAGRRVYIMQFMKGMAYSEQKVLRKLAPQLVLRTTGKPFFIAKEGMLTPEQRRQWGDDVVIFPEGQPPEDYVRLLQAGLAEAAEAILSGSYGLAVLDELNVALFFGLLERKSVEHLLNQVPEQTELVLTGRNAPDWLLARADLITQMQEVRHYYTRGVEARRGIEN